MSPTDPVALTQDLIRCPSVTPEEGGALALLEERLSAAGFSCTRVDRGGVSNLFARWGEKGHARSFGFNGHTDVVPGGRCRVMAARSVLGHRGRRPDLGPGRDGHEVGRRRLCRRRHRLRDRDAARRRDHPRDHG